MQKVARNEKKLLEISEVAKKLPSNLWKALYYFHQHNCDKRVKGNEDKLEFCCCSGSEKSRFKILKFFV